MPTKYLFLPNSQAQSLEIPFCLNMETDLEMADESNPAELVVVDESRLVQPTNGYGSPIAGAPSLRNEIPEGVNTSAVAVSNKVVSLGFILYRF